MTSTVQPLPPSPLARFHTELGQLEKELNDPRILPHHETLTRVKLADLLLGCTNNVEGAISHLQRSMTLIHGKPGLSELQCNILYLLSMAYKKSGNVKQCRVFLTQAFDSSKDCLIWRQMICYQLGEFLFASEDAQGAIAKLEEGLRVATALSNKHNQVVFRNSLAQVMLSTNNFAGSLLHLDTSAGLLTELMSAHYSSVASHTSTQADQDDDFVVLCDSTPTAQPVVPIAQSEQETLLLLKIHEVMIRSLHQLQAGDLKNANLLLPQLRRLLEQSASRYTQQCNKLELGWIHHIKLAAIADVVAVSCARPFGAFQTSLSNIQQGLKAITDFFDSYVEKQSLSAPAEYVDIARDLVSLKFLLWEHALYVYITSCQYKQAEETLVEMRAWYLNYHSILPNGAGASLCMSIGSYAQSLECLDEAVAWLSHGLSLASKPGVDPSKRFFAVFALCTAYIQRNAVEKAVELLGVHSRTIECGANKMTKALLAFLEGQFAYLRSQATTAREKFARVLSFVGGPSAPTPHSQLASMALCSITAIQLKLENVPTEKTEKALQTSIQLSDMLGDIPTGLFQLQLLAVLHDKRSNRTEQVNMMGVFATTQREHAAHLDTARSSAQTRKIFSDLYPRAPIQPPRASMAPPAAIMAPPAPVVKVPTPPKPAGEPKVPTATRVNRKRAREEEPEVLLLENVHPAPKRQKAKEVIEIEDEPEERPKRVASKRSAIAKPGSGQALQPITNGAYLIMKSKELAATMKATAVIGGQCSPRRTRSKPKPQPQPIEAGV